MSEVIQLGPVAYRAFDLPEVCQENAGHLHHYDHITVVQAGALKVFWKKPGEDAERETRVFRPGEFFLVKADVFHRIKAVEPGTRYACVFTHRDHEGAVVQEYEGHLEAYDLRDDGSPALQDVHAYDRENREAFLDACTTLDAEEADDFDGVRVRDTNGV